MWNVVLPTLLFLTSVFLVLLVLVQRGRGGGLAGAFGGLGGQSAFGTKAGDLFTRITIGVAAFWIILCAASVKLLNEGSQPLFDQGLGRSGAAATDSLAPGAASGKPKASDAKPGATGSSKSAPAQAAPAGEAADAPAGAAGSEKPAAGDAPATPAPAGTPENAK